MASDVKRFLFLLCCYVNFASGKLANRKYPVILVPGDGGSQLYASLNRSSVPHFYCEKKSDVFNIWLNIEEFSIPIECFVDNMRLRYDEKTHTTHDAPGVNIGIQDFGKTGTVEYLDPNSWLHKIPQLEYFYPIVNMLVTELNYTRDKDIKGAPYDFRRAPNELGLFYKNLTRLVEETYAENGNTPVVMIAHSMGNPVMLYFYNHMTPAWKDKYLRSHIALAGVWAGAVKPVRLMASGDALGVYVVSPLKVRPEQRAMPSTAFLLPSTRFWSSQEVLVVTQKRNYTAHDYQQFFQDIDYTQGYHLYQDTSKLIADLTPPGVEMHCLYGQGLDTPGTLLYPSGGFPDTYPTITPDDGDGTVNIRSLLAFQGWVGKQKQQVFHQMIPKAEHMEIMKDANTLKYIHKYLADTAR